MANKKRSQLIEDMFNAIELGDLQALSIAINGLESAESSSWVRRGISAIRANAGPSWTKVAREEKTAIGWIIERKWLAAFEIVEPMCNLSWVCDNYSGIRGRSPAEKCVREGWDEGLSIVLKRTTEEEKMKALRLACLNSLSCVKIILDAGCPPMPRHPMVGKEDIDLPFLLSPVHAASWAGSSDCLMELLSRGADPSKFDKSKIPSPLWIGLVPVEDKPIRIFDWRTFFLLANWTLRQSKEPVSWPINKDLRTPFMEIMRNPERLAQALAFKDEEMVGADILWQMAMTDPQNMKDVDGKGSVHWAKKASTDPASMAFKRKLLDKVEKGWSFAGQEAIIVAEDSDSAGSASGGDSENPPKSGGEESPLEKTQEPSPEDAMQMAIDQCLLEVSSLAAAMSSMSSAVENLERRMGERDAAEEASPPRHGAAEEASKNAISMMGKAESMRASLAAMAKMASMPKTASQRSMREK